MSIKYKLSNKNFTFKCGSLPIGVIEDFIKNVIKDSEYEYVRG